MQWLTTLLLLNVIYPSILYFQDIDYMLSDVLSAGSATGSKMWQDSLLEEKDLITSGKS